METGSLPSERTEIERVQNEEETIEQLLVEIRSAEKKAGYSVFVIGDCLDRIRKLRKQWYKLGSHCTSFDAVAKEIGYSPASAYNYIRIKETFLEYAKANPDYCSVGYTKLLNLLPIMYTKGGKPVDTDTGRTHLESALKLPTEKELRDYIKDIRGTKEDLLCQHDEVTTHYKCKCCKKWVAGNG